ncbi:MAG: hypothetical protein AAF787_24805 [Chloroflexota bacterium]
MNNRAGRGRRFSTLGARMLNFGRQVMRSYAPEDMAAPPEPEPNTPVARWGTQASEPLIWRDFAQDAAPAQADATGSYNDYAYDDAGYDPYAQPVQYDEYGNPIQRSPQPGQQPARPRPRQQRPPQRQPIQRRPQQNQQPPQQRQPVQRQPQQPRVRPAQPLNPVQRDGEPAEGRQKPVQAPVNRRQREQWEVGQLQSILGFHKEKEDQREEYRQQQIEKLQRKAEEQGGQLRRRGRAGVEYFNTEAMVKPEEEKALQRAKAERDQLIAQNKIKDNTTADDTDDNIVEGEFTAEAADTPTADNAPAVDSTIQIVADNTDTRV